ncbi:MAG TPA: hypothetical protein VEZ48_05135 [Sphingomonadaceae bacterium]|nr:hypothetical protein [Sphingomonadaceae bacterium]
MRTPIALGLALSAAFAGAPALAQYAPPQTRAGQVADDIARTVVDTAQAVGRVRDSLDRSVNDIRWRGPQRFAIDACRPSVERYGRMRVEDVQPYKRRSQRVYGIAEGYRAGYYERSRSAARSFTCTVRDDGRVKVKTKKLRYARY